MQEFTTSIDIAAPPERVWQVMSDTDHWFEWTPSITSVKRLDDAPFAVGTKVLIRQPKLPPAKWTVTAIEPDRTFTWISTAPGLKAIGKHSVTPTPSGSRATLSLQLHGLLGEAFGRLTKDISERYVAFEANGLKARSENPQFHHAEGRR